MIPTLCDHLWQSTLFACAAGLLALALRRHSARARYWAWLAASMKFLVPFSLLESVGSWLAPGAQAPLLPQPLAYAVNSISAPFPAVIAPVAPPHIGWLPWPDVTTLLAGVWLAGSLAIVAAWTVRWLQLLAVVRTARAVDIAAPVPVLATCARIEPGLVGIRRPVLLLPLGLTERLSEAQIRSLIAHEVCHLRRRDNLTAAIHMLVEAVFWFYPLTWWLGTRLLAERERACDESVLAAGHDPKVYAEGILKVCRFYVQAPLACTAGVSGADLKRRIEEIMSHSAVRGLSTATRASIVLAGALSLAAPLLYGLLAAPALGVPPAAGASPASGNDIAHRLYEQSRPQQEVPFNPADFDRFAGYYRVDHGDTYTHVYRTGGRYYMQVTGQPAVEFFPESPTKFFATLAPVQISFVTGPGGRVTGLVIHQAGLRVPASRATRAAYDGANAELARRIKANVPSSGTQAKVLEYIRELESGRAQDYRTMTPVLAAAARAQYPKASALVRRQGAFESLKFTGVAPNGWDMYVATFSHGRLYWLIAPLTADGKVPGLLVRPFP